MAERWIRRKLAGVELVFELRHRLTNRTAASRHGAVKEVIKALPPPVTGKLTARATKQVVADAELVKSVPQRSGYKRLSLCETPADFVALSFYKMFGYPTGLGGR